MAIQHRDSPVNAFNCISSYSQDFHPSHPLQKIRKKVWKPSLLLFSVDLWSRVGRATEQKWGDTKDSSKLKLEFDCKVTELI
jgi:hypothetical protein